MLFQKLFCSNIFDINSFNKICQWKYKMKIDLVFNGKSEIFLEKK